MVRVARVVAKGCPHHITQRGNNRQVVFNDDKDREKYLSLINFYSRKYRLDILAYCLMTNHVHFIAVPKAADSISKTFNFAHMRYSQYYNRKNDMCGHFWQGRFYSCAMDQQYVYACARYIERNPVRAKIIRKPWKYKWSSAQVHCGIKKSDDLGTELLFNYIDEKFSTWRKFIDKEDDKSDLKKLKQHTMKGLPMGEESFIKKIEKQLGRVLTVIPRGRPRKKIGRNRKEIRRVTGQVAKK